MNPTKKIAIVVVTAGFVFAPIVQELACARAEASEFYASIRCELSGRQFHAPFGESCDALDERSFPAHNHDGESNGQDEPTTTVVSVSGNSTANNVAVGMYSFGWPSNNFKF